jgi:hypothetical protein
MARLIAVGTGYCSSPYNVRSACENTPPSEGEADYFDPSVSLMLLHQNRSKASALPPSVRERTDLVVIDL